MLAVAVWPAVAAPTAECVSAQSARDTARGEFDEALAAAKTRAAALGITPDQIAAYAALLEGGVTEAEQAQARKMFTRSPVHGAGLADLGLVRALLDSANQLDEANRAVSAACGGGDEQPAPHLSGLGCAGFATREDAQEALDAGQADPAKVDRNSNGAACDEQVAVAPNGGVDTGGWPAE